MEENLDELQAKVARLAGRINRHKSTGSNPGLQAASTGILISSSGDRISQLNIKYQREEQGYRIQKPTARAPSPFGVTRGRGWTPHRYAPHRNRTLVLKGSQPQQDQESLQSSTDGPSTPGWVTKRDRHMQLINNAVFDQKTQERSQAMEETRKQKQIAREKRELAKINSHLVAVARSQANLPSSATEGAAAPAHFLFVNDIKFLVADGGSKLMKVNGMDGQHQLSVKREQSNDMEWKTDEVNKLKVPPKRVSVGGVTFLRSKHGNLYRAGLVKAKRSDSKDLLSGAGVQGANLIFFHSGNGVKSIAEPCQQFSTTGTCSKGPNCRYIHDPDKVAICRDFLLTGKCQADTDCDLSHNPIPERVPACLHFQRGNCTNPQCRYAHVRTNPGAPVCRAFATLGYCSKGLTCAERHIHECPDYANKGFCRNKNCRLPHVDRAGQLRKKQATAQEGEDERQQDEDNSSDVSSDNDLDGIDSDDVDSSDFEEDLPVLEQVEGHELARQNDFVSLKQ